MRFIGCTTCRRIVQLGGELEEIKSLLHGDKNFPCITPLCRGRMLHMQIGQIDKDYIIREMAVQNFFKAVQGFGDGATAAPVERLKELLLSKKVVGAVLFPIGKPERSIVQELILEDGTRLHFDISNAGACVYYIEEPIKEEVKDELPVVADGQGVAAHREEVGRDAQAADEIEPLDIWLPEPAGTSPRADELQNTKRVSSVPATSDLSTSRVPGPSRSGDR